MKPALLFLTVFAAFGQDSEVAAGRAYYAEGDFRKAAASFQLALKANSDDAEAWYWMGMSYQRLADIATPFGGRDFSKARGCLAKAMELAPGRPDYRDALFDLLLDSADSSRTALRDAAGILLTMPESDPDLSDMRRRLENERKVRSSANARLGRLFLMVPRAAYGIAALPASASDRHLAASWSRAGE